MKKLVFLFGVAVGFLLGSKAGPDAYNQVEKKVRSVVDRPEVQQAMDKAKSAAQEQVGQISDKVNEKLPSGTSGSSPGSSGSASGSAGNGRSTVGSRSSS